MWDEPCANISRRETGTFFTVRGVPYRGATDHLDLVFESEMSTRFPWHHVNRGEHCPCGMMSSRAREYFEVKEPGAC